MGLNSLGFSNNPADESKMTINQPNSRRGGNFERYTSNERGQREPNNQGVMMSPFEKKIASYQKSAERRKQGNERSGSRSRGVMGAPPS